MPPLHEAHVKGEIASLLTGASQYITRCYKKEREEPLKGQGILREEWLEGAS